MRTGLPFARPGVRNRRKTRCSCVLSPSSDAGPPRARAALDRCDSNASTADTTVAEATLDSAAGAGTAAEDAGAKDLLPAAGAAAAAALPAAAGAAGATAVDACDGFADGGFIAQAVSVRKVCRDLCGF